MLVATQDVVGLESERLPCHGRGDVGIAVAITADP
jgi:hypothetical protein